MKNDDDTFLDVFNATEIKRMINFMAFMEFCKHKNLYITNFLLGSSDSFFRSIPVVKT